MTTRTERHDIHETTDWRRSNEVNEFFHFQFSSPAFDLSEKCFGFVKGKRNDSQWEIYNTTSMFYSEIFRLTLGDFLIFSLLSHFPRVSHSCFFFSFSEYEEFWMNIHYQLCFLCVFFLSWQRGFWLWSQIDSDVRSVKFNSQSFFLFLLSFALSLTLFTSVLYDVFCVVPPNNTAQNYLHKFQYVLSIKRFFFCCFISFVIGSIFSFILLHVRMFFCLRRKKYFDSIIDSRVNWRGSIAI